MSTCVPPQHPWAVSQKKYTKGHPGKSSYVNECTTPTPRRTPPVCSHAIPYSYPVFWQQVKNKVTKVTLCPNPVQTARWGYGGWPISGVSPVRFLYMIQQHINAVFNGGELCLRLSTRAPPQHLWEKPPQWSCHGTMGLGGSLPVDQEVPCSSLTGCG